MEDCSVDKKACYYPPRPLCSTTSQHSPNVSDPSENQSRISVLCPSGNYHGKDSCAALPNHPETYYRGIGRAGSPRYHEPQLYRHPATQDLGPISNSPDNFFALWVHDTMAFTVEGVPLGLLDVQCWARDPQQFGKKKLRHQLSIEHKESYKWLKSFQRVAKAQNSCPNTMLVSIGDREADIYELIEMALGDPLGPKLPDQGYTKQGSCRRTRTFMEQGVLTGNLRQSWGPRATQRKQGCSGNDIGHTVCPGDTETAPW